MQKFTVNADGFINNVWLKKGQEVEFDPRAVKFLTAPYGDRLTPVKDKPASPKKTSTKDD